jgi:hypothetical protein
MITLQIQVRGVGGVTRKFTAFDKWVTQTIPNLTKKQAEDGSQLLVQLMPKDTNAMIQAVSVRPQRDSWSIISRTPKPAAGRLARPYHIWYNEGKRGWYKGGKKSGQYRYYETTRDYLAGKFPKRVMNDLKRVIGG